MKDKQIKQLQNFLKENSFIGENNNLIKILKLAENQDLMKWQQLLEKINAPIPQQIFGQLLSGIVDSSRTMLDSAQQLVDLGDQEIQNLLQSAKQHPELKAALSGDKFIKNAQVLNFLKNLGGKALKLIPLMSFVIALKNFLYGVREFAYLLIGDKNLGLEWYDIFIPQKISSFIDQNENNCEKLSEIVDVIKSMKIFIDETVSLIVNSIDGVKDLIFLVINFGTGFITFGIDIGISIVLAIIDFFVDKTAKENYNLLLSKIEKITKHQIAALTSNLPEVSSVDFSKLSPDEIIAELDKINTMLG